MRIIVPTTRGGLDDFVSQAFGRAQTFTIVDVDENGNISNVQVVPNPGINAPRGAGIQAAQFCINQGAGLVIGVTFGPNSSQVLQASGIRFVSAAPNMTVEQAIQAFFRGELTQAVFGPEGGGMGRGMGRGRGRW
ncbi:NifB/NifX family molybdenum-iron cluster-binding protein [Palaeococcus sp. (in: euryarchaeotes)]|uniref:NifB/NifX family molybdenum-iron cluster-binding protein n=1 Tax=Palaeococcus sp. (in: euryarchaeotes) TaxID=2820298 RepID=UPI000F1BF0AE|nr:NifB/NifX family molybdenum-iron cluster-binding protein [Palaeococcus sp. (in: euryarchaeotes)]MCD6558579.1 NifB/NifX family molybdenum-iron cluster-binding protein [Palaeococcus sp. (in: euryarchaeotes)]RLF77654.1 MAG: dinitrogenase iron-molybdenum cofactor [Thermococci archaeon]